MSYGDLIYIIENIADENAENSYNEFFKLSREELLTEKEVVETVVRIRQRLCPSNSPVLRSYALLLLASAVDSAVKTKTSSSEVSSLVQFLISEVSDLDDFRNFDEQGYYIHFVSHLAYLGHALSDAGLPTKGDAATLAREICLMYGRTKSVYFLDEPFVVGGLILMLCKGQAELLNSALEVFRIERVEQELGLVQRAIFIANYNYLCMGISELNAKYAIVPDAPIHKYLDKILDMFRP